MFRSGTSLNASVASVSTAASLGISSSLPLEAIFCGDAFSQAVPGISPIGNRSAEFLSFRGESLVFVRICDCAGGIGDKAASLPSSSFTLRISLLLVSEMASRLFVRVWLVFS